MHNPARMEYALRALAILMISILFLGFGIYFGTPVSDAYLHDWIFFGGGVLSLLAGIGTLLGFLGMLVKLRQEFGDDIISDIGYPELAGPPPNRGGAAARAAAAEDSADSEDV
ncbi:MAG: hypothetical protein M3010_01350 [Candidatus Dormibacteraeota bacterium]|nr:hypothetical protein [Candidatus Dormibacteraeota bacterium]